MSRQQVRRKSNLGSSLKSVPIHLRFSPDTNLPRAERFKPLKRIATPDFLTPISSLSKRTCTFGIGGRLDFKSLTGRDSPSPDTYRLPTCFEKEKGGPIMTQFITISRKKKIESPGPGSYNPHSPLGKNAKKFSFKSRIVKEIRTDTPPPNTYNPCFSLVNKGAFQTIGFGIGERMKPPSSNRSPGPGTYDLPSIFAAQTERSAISKESFKNIYKKHS